MKKYQRFLSLLLCFSLLLLLFVGLRPVRASAAEALVDIATSYGDIVQVAPYLIPFILILIGLDWYYSNIDEIVAKAEELYANSSSSVKKWAENVSAQIIDGTSAFKIPTIVTNDINKQMEGDDKKLPPALPYVLIPATFLALDTLSQSDVLAQDVSGLLGQGNTLAVETNSILGSIRSFLGYISTGITSSLDTIANKISSISTDISGFFTTKLWELRQGMLDINASIADSFHTTKQQLLDINVSLATSFRDARQRLIDINVNIADFFHTTKQQLLDVNSSLATFFRDARQRFLDINTNLASIKTTIGDKITSLGASVSNSFDALGEKFKGYFSDITTSISTWSISLGNRIETLLNPAPALPDTSVSDEVATQEGALKDSIVVGFDEGKRFFGLATDFFADDLSAFLVVGMIFNEFAGIPIFHKLLIISCSIGLVATLLGMALEIKSFSVSQRRREAAAQSRARGRMERSLVV